jgi:hypothetical protein
MDVGGDGQWARSVSYQLVIELYMSRIVSQSAKLLKIPLDVGAFLGWRWRGFEHVRTCSKWRTHSFSVVHPHCSSQRRQDHGVPSINVSLGVDEGVKDASTVNWSHIQFLIRPLRRPGPIEKAL